MEIKLLSDLHTEFTPFDYVAKAGDENRVLVLAGDIGVGTGAKQLIEEFSKIFNHVIYLLGNHEFYHGEIHNVKKKWREIEETIPNLTILDDSSCIVNGVRFVGGTLWTSMNNNDWFCIQTAKKGMNDYAVCGISVNGEVRNLKPMDTITLHNVTVSFIKEELQKTFDGPTVVATHHLPLWQAIDEQYKGLTLNGAFATDLENIFRDYEFDVWLYGHTHRSRIFEDVYGKRTYCNPRGYVKFDPNPDFTEDMIIKV